MGCQNNDDSNEKVQDAGVFTLDLRPGKGGQDGGELTQQSVRLKRMKMEISHTETKQQQPSQQRSGLAASQEATDCKACMLRVLT